jgi:hypothetical protein
MPAHYTILLIIGVAALIGLIVSLLGLLGLVPIGRPIGAEDYDHPDLTWFLISCFVLAADGAVAAVALLWQHDPSHIAATGLAVLLLIVVGRWIWRVFGSSLASSWSKLAPRPAAVPTKKPWVSKTIVLNALVAGGLVAEAKLSFLQGVLPASKYQIVAFVLPIVNVLLRAYTNQGLSLKAILPSTESSQ